MPENPYSSPQSPLYATPSGVPQEAPGARAAFHCGLWALISVLLCYPISLVLAIIALVQTKKARRYAREEPQLYQTPSSAGMIMGIIALAVLPVLMIIGMISAIAIPALLGQRARARDKAAIQNLLGRASDLAARYDEVCMEGIDEASIVPALENHLREKAGQDKNPWSMTQPAFSYTITVVDDLDQEALVDFSKGQATVLGQGAFVVQLPSKAGEPVEHPGYLVGVTQTKNPTDGSTCFTKVIAF